jgi:hypothetical protein
MKWKQFKRPMLLGVAPAGLLVFGIITKPGNSNHPDIYSCNINHPKPVCVMKAIFGLDEDESDSVYFIPSSEVEKATKSGMEWIKNAQGDDGGWGAGSHYNQGIRDPHAVPSDPATTSLVAMAIMRTDSTIQKGVLSPMMKKATDYLLKVVETCPDNQTFLTNLTNTQPQVKLGRNIDVILTAQFFTNLLRYQQNNQELKKNVDKALDKCIARIQRGQDKDGSWKDGGWAPVLQSALANNALESAQQVGRKVDTAVMQKSQQYQAGNFDAKTNAALTDRAAGVVLYSVSSTARASAGEAKKAKDIIAKAKKEGKIKTEEINSFNLQAAGLSVTEAKDLETAYNINTAARQQALRDDVMNGFGNNGGEEFLSYLMTGESMVMQGGEDWKKWYDMITGKLVKIQNQDGSWNGHHCITSPVFCTGTCLLILSIHKDMQFAMNLHHK